MSDGGARIVLVGHCMPDAYMLRSAVQRAVPGAQVEMVNDDASLNDRDGSELLLVNRVLDGEFGARGGVELIEHLAARRGSDGLPVLMLVSNLEDAQAEAVRVGATPGFGKREAYSAKAASLLRQAVERSTKDVT